MLKKYSSMRLMFAAFVLIAVAVVGFAANFGNVKFFDFIGVQAEKKDSNAKLLETINQPMLTLGTCDTAGPVEIESSGGTTAPTAYSTLKNAFDAINAGTHTGTVNIEVCASTTEPAGSAVLNSSGAGSASYTQININPIADGLTISGASESGRGLIELNGADNVTIDGDNPNSAGMNRNLTIQNTAVSTTTYAQVIRVALATTAVTSANSNTIKNLNLLGHATGRNINTADSTTGSENTSYGILAGSGASTTSPTTAPSAVTSISETIDSGATASNLTVTNNNITNAARGIAVQGAATSVFPGLLINNNAIGNPTVGAADGVYAIGISANGSANAVISGNTINVEGFVPSTSSNSAIQIGTVGAAINGATIEKNKINKVISGNLVGFNAWGINLATGNNHIVRNNFVSGIMNVPNSTFSTTSGAHGIRILAGTGHFIYHNSVNMSGDLTGSSNAALTSALCIVSTSSTGMDIRNNILVNTQTQTGATVPADSAFVAIYLPSGATSAMNLTLNNNNYFIGTTPAVNNGYGQAGTTAGTGFFSTFTATTTTPATNLRSYTSQLNSAGTNDNASKNVDPQFISASDLHIQATSQVQGMGTAVASVPNDIDGEVRQLPPDIGADEIFVIVPGTVQFSTASYSGSEGNTATVTVNRVGGSAGAIQVSYATGGGTANSGMACGTGIDYINTSGTLMWADADTAAKTFIVQLCTDGVIDNNESLQLTLSNPFGTAITGTNPATLNIVDVPPPFSGSFNVGTGENFTSLTNPGGIFAGINGSGATGNITINITSDLTAETGAVALNQIAGNFTVLIKPSGAARTITGTNTAASVIKLNDADNVTIDGSLNGSTDRSLSIVNSNTADNTAVIWVASNTNGAQGNTIKNLNLAGGADQSVAFASNFGIVSSSGTAILTGATDNDNNTYTNNFIRKVGTGIASIGANAANLNQNTTISNNLIGPSAFGNEQISLAGVLIFNENSANITRNEVRFIGDSATTGGSSGRDHVGISLGTSGAFWSSTTAPPSFAVTNANVSRNTIHDIVDRGTFSAVGIVQNASNGANPTANTIANNMIYNIQSNGTVDNQGVGIGISNGRGDTIVYNSIFMTGDIDPGAAASATISSFGISVPFAAPTNLTLKNNISVMDISSNTSSLNHAAFNLQSTGFNFGTGGSNFNDFYANPANTQARIAATGGTFYSTIAAYKAAVAPQDANTVSVDPLFVSATDLHIQLASPLKGAGTPIPSVTIDFDGETRSPNIPEIGADEVITAGSLQFDSTTYTVGEALTNIILTVSRTGGVDGAVSVNYALTNGTATGGAACGAGVDFINTGGTVSFANGETSKMIIIPNCDDLVFEGDETFTVTLSNATGGATIGTPATATVTLLDNETPMFGNLAFSSPAYSNLENTIATISVNRTNGTMGSVSVNYATSGSSAAGGTSCTAGVDFINTSGTLTFAPGQTTRTFNVTLCSDSATEGDETVLLTLSNPTGGAIIVGENPAVLTIVDVPVSLSGTYTVGSGGNYPSLTNTGGIFQALNNVGASGNVTINIISNLINENGSIALNEITGGFAVTIKPVGGNRSITGSSTTSIIKLNGADNVTIDGSLTGGTAAGQVGGDPLLRNLTIQNTSPSATGGAVVAVSSGANGAQNITVKNVNISGQDPTQTLYGIHIGGDTIGSNGTDNDDIRVENCSFQKSIVGIFNAGNGAANHNTGNVITLNDMSSTGANRLRRGGMLLANHNGLQVTLNRIGGIDTNETNADAYGIGLGISNFSTTETTSGNVINSVVSRNRITGVTNTSTVGLSAVGIGVAGGPSGANTISNNMVSGIIAPSTSSDIVAGIFVAGATGSDTRLYYNSVALSGNRGTTPNQNGSYAIAITGSSPVVELKNNIFYNTQTSGGGTSARSYSIGMVASNFANFNSNYNDFFASGTNASFFRTGSLGSLGGTQYTNLTLFSAATSSDANSQEVDPLYFDPLTDLHLQQTSPVADDGTPIASITVDIDGNLRSATAPEIGADELVPAVSGTLQFDSSTYVAGEAVTNIILTVSRTGGSDGPVSVNYTLTNGTATGGAACGAGVDFVNTGGTVNFANGETSKNILVPNCDDLILEGNETFMATLSNVTGGATIGTPATATVTILDNETPMPRSLSFSSGAYSVGESAGTLQVTINRTNGTNGAATVDYNFSNTSATGGATCAAGIDFINAGGTVSFADGDASRTFNITICPDSLSEANETFNVTLSNPTGGAVLGAPTTAVVTITDDDPIPTLSINDVTQNEGNSGTSVFAFTVTLSTASGSAVTVAYQTANGTATILNNDYQAIDGTLTFTPGQTTKTINVLVNGDIVLEPNENFFVNLSNPTNATIADGQGMGTITNDDLQPQGLSINNVRLMEGNSGTVTATFTVTLAPLPSLGGNPSDITVQYSTADGTAKTANGDYVAATGTLNFGSTGGPTTRTISVTVNGDLNKEANETFFVNLSNPVNATIADGQGVGIIIDDDRTYVSDFDRDGKSDYTVYRPDTSVWYIFQSSNNIPKITPLGASGDVAVPGDYDGDGITDAAVFRASDNNWYILQSQGKTLAVVNWGTTGDIPVQADYDGDGKTDVAMFRPSDGKWYIIRSTDNSRPVFQFGANGDLPVIGDFDGDFKNDLTVFRNGVWYVFRSSDFGVAIVNWGTTGDKPVSGDFDGDGKTDYAIYRNGTWWIFYSLTNSFSAINWGLATDIPAPADYDGDGTTDVAIFRPSEGNWYVLRSSDFSLNVIKWGTAGDIPGPAAYTPRQ